MDAMMIERILRAYDNASAADMAEGASWYDTAQFTARALAAGTRLSVEQAAGVIAALSPRVQWRNNVNAAAVIINNATHRLGEPRVAGFYRNRSKAWRISNGGDPVAILGGPKVTNFYANIIGDINAVTVDVWAARAAEGESNNAAPAGKRYNAIANAYRDAADARNVSPMVMQATVWVYIRRTFGIGDQMTIDWEN